MQSINQTLNNIFTDMEKSPQQRAEILKNTYPHLYVEHPTKGYISVDAVQSITKVNECWKMQ